MKKNLARSAALVAGLGTTLVASAQTDTTGLDLGALLGGAGVAGFIGLLVVLWILRRIFFNN